ncbi:MAG: hypothetical protein HUU46_09160 [Candidatus Hydrogenedentes bacterium]|nr:hypothetical protein [Candidatus Hydrogenedentota bacterium]
MATQGESKRLSFSDRHIDAQWINQCGEFPVHERCIIVNVAASPIFVESDAPSIIRPWTSTVLQHALLRNADSLIVLRILESTNIGGVVLGPKWEWFGDREPSFPRDIPLYVSSQDPVGSVTIDPRRLAGMSPSESLAIPFDVKVNLWYCPGNTDCVIHTGHKFLEVHTQIFGTGRMQKFHENDEHSLYEDVIMGPGLTHHTFAAISGDGSWKYPWHRYYGDTDCIWLAVELHAQTS